MVIVEGEAPRLVEACVRVSCIRALVLTTVVIASEFCVHKSWESGKRNPSSPYIGLGAAGYSEKEGSPQPTSPPVHVLHVRSGALHVSRLRGPHRCCTLLPRCPLVCRVVKPSTVLHVSAICRFYPMWKSLYIAIKSSLITLQKTW